MQEMERQMRLNEDVLRHMTVRTEEVPEGPSVMMQGRGDRERASRDGDGRPSRDSQSRENRAPDASAVAVETTPEKPAAKAPADEAAAKKGDEE